jgi:hypothetical protein
MGGREDLEGPAEVCVDIGGQPDQSAHGAAVARLHACSRRLRILELIHRPVRMVQG